jgi:replication fork protection complex subunit Csm3/Swi3
MATLSDTPILDEGNDYNKDDDLFDYEAGLDEALRSLTNLPHNGQSVSNSASADHSAVALGLETEVKVQKKRAPIAKLDEAR